MRGCRHYERKAGNKVWLTVKEVAELLGISKQAVQKTH